MCYKFTNIRLSRFFFMPATASHHITHASVLRPFHRMLVLQVIAVIIVAAYILMMVLSRKNAEARKKGF